MSPDRKKRPKLSRLGELLNTQKNVHFFAPRGAPGGGAPLEAQKCTQNGPILGVKRLVFLIARGPEKAPF